MTKKQIYGILSKHRETVLQNSTLTTEYIDYFNFVECRRARRHELKQRSILLSKMPEEHPEKTHELLMSVDQEERTTSYTEYEVDAWAHQAEEGRGDRRNVERELHASDELSDSE